MRAQRALKRLFAGLLLLAVVGAAGGLHHHESLTGGSLAGQGASRVVSNHSPFSKASHWHSGTRVQDDPCLACHVHRFAAVAARAQGPAPAEIGLFVSHASPRSAALVFRLCDPTRGPPSIS